jgi:hypothetical protein
MEFARLEEALTAFTRSNRWAAASIPVNELEAKTNGTAMATRKIWLWLLPSKQARYSRSALLGKV